MLAWKHTNTCILGVRVCLKKDTKYSFLVFIFLPSLVCIFCILAIEDITSSSCHWLSAQFLSVRPLRYTLTTPRSRPPRYSKVEKIQSVISRMDYRLLRTLSSEVGLIFHKTCGGQVDFPSTYWLKFFSLSAFLRLLFPLLVPRLLRNPWMFAGSQPGAL